MCYTSGTTGNPKGVVYSHRSNYLHAMQVILGMDFSQGDRLLAVVPMFHANAWGLPYAAMMSGASLIMPDRFLQAEPLARMIETERVTGGGAVPTIWNDLLRYLDEHPTDTSSVRSVVVGGAACPPALMRAMQERHGITVIHAWGMTEMSPLGTTAVPPAGTTGEEHWRYRETQGRIARGVQARLVGPDGAEQPWDGRSVGELEVKGPWITGSYYDNGSNTEAERADAAAKFDDGWLRTGDVGSLTSDGYLTLTDRAKDVIKSGGEWISSVDLENALMAHPDVDRGLRRRRPGRQVGRASPGHGGRASPGRRSTPSCCGSSSPAGSRTGRCPSAGPSSTRCPRPASASSTRRCCAGGTPRATCRSRRWRSPYRPHRLRAPGRRAAPAGPLTSGRAAHLRVSRRP